MKTQTSTASLFQGVCQDLLDIEGCLGQDAEMGGFAGEVGLDLGGKHESEPVVQSMGRLSPSTSKRTGTCEARDRKGALFMSASEEGTKQENE